MRNQASDGARSGSKACRDFDYHVMATTHVLKAEGCKQECTAANTQHRSNVTYINHSAHIKNWL